MMRVKPIISKIMSTAGASAQSTSWPPIGSSRFATFSPARFTIHERAAVDEDLLFPAVDQPEQLRLKGTRGRGIQVLVDGQHEHVIDSFFFDLHKVGRVGRHPLKLANSLLHGEHIFRRLVPILHAIHEAAHQVNAEPAERPLFQRQG